MWTYIHLDILVAFKKKSQPVTWIQEQFVQMSMTLHFFKLKFYF